MSASSYELEGITFPAEIKGVNYDEVPDKLRTVFATLSMAALRGSELYALQRHLLKLAWADPDRYKGDNKAKLPYSVPGPDGKFVNMWEHPAFQRPLGQAKGFLGTAESQAQMAGARDLEAYLRFKGHALYTGAYRSTVVEWIKISSDINFMLAPIETEHGKCMWHGYLGIVDKEETRSLRKEMAFLKDSLRETYPDVDMPPVTDVRVDNPHVMSGFLSKEAQKVRREERGLPDIGPISAENLPNNPQDAAIHGTRVTIFGGAFTEVVEVYMRSMEADYVAPSVITNRRDALRAVATHEEGHNVRSKHNTGKLHKALRESAASIIGLNAARGKWNENAIVSAGRGSLGYAFRDCTREMLIGEKIYSTADDAADDSDYIIGSLGLLNLGIGEGAFLRKGGIIVGIDPDKLMKLTGWLSKEQVRLLMVGTYHDVRRHFEEVLPKGPLFRQDPLPNGEKLVIAA